MVNVLLAISVLRPEADERHTQLKGPGAEPTTPPRRAHRENADRGGRELPDRGGTPAREISGRQHGAVPAAGGRRVLVPTHPARRGRAPAETTGTPPRPATQPRGGAAPPLPAPRHPPPAPRPPIAKQP